MMLLLTMVTKASSQTTYLNLKNGSSSLGFDDPVLSNASSSEFDGYGGAGIPNAPFAYCWYAAALTIGNSARGVQIAHAYPSYDELFFRGGTDGWRSWRRILNDANYSSYALPLSGGSLTGSLSGISANFSDKVTAAKIKTGQLTIEDSWDNVLKSVQDGNTYHLIGSYKGWDPKAVYIAGYNAGNMAGVATERVYIGEPTTGKHLTVNLLNGGVGIGTNDVNDPNYRLFVETGIRTRKVKVDQTSWPDYVFDSSYRLPALCEVQAFIEQHKHLPDVPSAKEVKENGLDVGENQALLLKKIEEQMLYILELDKEIQSLRQEINQLKNK